MEYYSRALSDKKPKLATTPKACLPFIWAVTFLRPYLREARFTIQTGHEALRSILTMDEVTVKLFRWRIERSYYDFNIIHCAREKYQTAEALFRLNTKDTDHTPFDNEFTDSTTFARSFAGVRSTIEPNSVNIPEIKGVSPQFILEACLLAGIRKIEKAELRTPSEFLTA